LHGKLTGTRWRRDAYDSNTRFRFSGSVIQRLAIAVNLLGDIAR
jgi:hypothetical protein